MLGSAYEVALFGNYAFTANYNGGLGVIDITNIEEPKEVNRYKTGNIFSGIPFVGGNYLYLPGDVQDLQIIDISNPKSPKEVGYYDSESSAYNVFVQGNFAYLTGGGNSLKILNLLITLEAKSSLFGD